MGCASSSPASAPASPSAKATRYVEAKEEEAKPPPPAATAAPPAPKQDGRADVVVPLAFGVTVAEWMEGFDTHANATEGPGFYGYKVSEPRSAFCDESKTVAYAAADGSQEVLVSCADVDVMKMGAFMGEPAFKAMSLEQKSVPGAPGMLVDMPAPDAGVPPPSSDAVVLLELKDGSFDAWYDLFKQHADGHNVGGVEVKYSRAEICDEARTKVYRSGNKVAITVFGVNEKMGELMANDEFQKLITEVGGVVSQAVKAFVAMPPPPETPAMPEPVAKMLSGANMIDNLDYFMANLSDDMSMSFEGEFAPPMPPLDKAKFMGMGKMMTASFPDFGFDPATPPVPTEDGGFWSLVYSHGTHTGAPFALPGKPPVDASGVSSRFGPTQMKVYADASGEKLAKIVFVPLKAGPTGPPAYYVASGGDLSATLDAPPAEA